MDVNIKESKTALALIQLKERKKEKKRKFYKLQL